MITDYLQANQPDILEVIANLSNDAVFTPPRVVNSVLDLLPTEVWADPTLRWLDPGAKTGVFPREITKRLMVGIADAFPNEEARLHHILMDVVFAIATEEITGMMTRRSLYCSKDASGELSAVRFQSSDGNVWHHRVEHSFDANGRCGECRGTKGQLEQPGIDNKAYGFIHASGRSQIRKEINMEFDVIVGNPPYQMTDGGPGGSASPIYQDFVQQAIELNPRYVAMIVPSRWFVGGKGLGEFRNTMLADRRVRTIVDYQDARMLFPGINLNGGVNYFLWDRDHDGPCSVTSVHQSGRQSTVSRELSSHDVFIRLNEAIPILDKVRKLGEKTFESKVSRQRPFGLRTFFKGSNRKPASDPVELYGNRSLTWIRRDKIEVNTSWVDKWKVFIPAATDGNENYPLPVLTEPIVAGPGTACTETYLLIGPCKSKAEAENTAAYLTTRFFRFLLSQRKHTQHNSREMFSFIPDLDMGRKWIDEDLYVRYGITDDEQDFIAEQTRLWAS